MEHKAAMDAGALHDFEPTRPWEWVWAQTTLGAPFWRRELEEPCLLVLSKPSSLGALIDGDAAIDRAQAQAASSRSPLPRRSGPGRPKESPRGRVEKVHKVSGDTYDTNRSGSSFCGEWLAGNCSEAPGRCPANRARVHQCNKCLGHGKGRSRGARS